MIILLCKFVFIINQMLLLHQDFLMFTLFASFTAYATVSILQNEISIAIKRLKPVIRSMIK